MDKQEFSEKQGEVLLSLARQTIAEKMGYHVLEEEKQKIDKVLQEDVSLQAERGVFVTLTKEGQLRGCIGSIAGYEPITQGVKRNAVNAAVGDPRFRPLQPKEFDEIDIEVSILTEPKPLEYKDAEDLVNKLRPDVDGVIIRSGRSSATFLPQVWEQLPRTDDFLTRLCLKAGLSGDAWRRMSSQLEVLTYQVQYFSEDAHE